MFKSLSGQRKPIWGQLTCYKALRAAAGSRRVRILGGLKQTPHPSITLGGGLGVGTCPESPQGVWIDAGIDNGTPKSAPVFLQLRDCGGLREVEVTACLVWKDWPHRVHPHSLVGKDCTDGVCRVRLRPHVSPRHRYPTPTPDPPLLVMESLRG